MRPGVKRWLYENLAKIPLLNSNGVLDKRVIPQNDDITELYRMIENIPKINKVEIVNSLSEPGVLGELKFYEGDLYAWLPDTNQIPTQNAWVALTFGVLDGGVITA